MPKQRSRDPHDARLELSGKTPTLSASRHVTTPVHHLRSRSEKPGLQFSARDLIEVNEAQRKAGAGAGGSHS